MPREQRGELLRETSAWFRCFLLLCSDLALRFREAKNATPSGWDHEAGTLTVRAKGGYDHTLPLTDELTAILQSLPADADVRKPIVDLLAGRHIGDSAIRMAWKRLKAKLAIADDTRIHDLRRTTATALYDLTKDLRVVQQLLGHHSLRSTTHYLAEKHPAELRGLLESLKLPTEVKQ